MLKRRCQASIPGQIILICSNVPHQYWSRDSSYLVKNSNKLTLSSLSFLCSFLSVGSTALWLEAAVVEADFFEWDASLFRDDLLWSSSPEELERSPDNCARNNNMNSGHVTRQSFAARHYVYAILWNNSNAERITCNDGNQLSPALMFIHMTTSE